MSGYTVVEGFIILDENSNIVDWFDDEEEAYKYIEEIEEM